MTHVEPWLSELELLEWVRAGASRAAYQRRLAVWLTYLRHFPAHEGHARITAVLATALTAANRGRAA